MTGPELELLGVRDLSDTLGFWRPILVWVLQGGHWQNLYLKSSQSERAGECGQGTHFTENLETNTAAASWL